MLRFEQVSVSVPGRCLVCDFSAEFRLVHWWHCVGVMGRVNLVIACCFGLRPSTGTISIDSELVHHLSFQQRAQKWPTFHI